MKIVKKATVEVVRARDLKATDKILFSDLILIVSDVNPINGYIRARSLDGQLFNALRYRRYYKIIGKADVVEACEHCGNETAGEKHGEICDKCYVKGVMGSYEDPETGKRWTDKKIREAIEEMDESWMG